jgi:hypothetical protein
MEGPIMSEIELVPIHFKLQTWAVKKEDGLMPAVIIPSIRLNPEQIKEFEESGAFQKAYDAFREYCLRNNPNLQFIGEKRN